MNNQNFIIKKNVLDLEHSEKLSRGITKIGAAMTGFVAIFLTLKGEAFADAVITAAIWCLMFLVMGFSDLEDCKNLRKEVCDLANKERVS